MRSFTATRLRRAPRRTPPYMSLTRAERSSAMGDISVSPAVSPAKSRTGVPELEGRDFGLALFLAVLLFVFIPHPFWRHPWDVDVSIIYSYFAIPFVAGALLWRRHALSPGSLALATIE